MNEMQKLEGRNTYTPTNAPQVRGNCDSVIKHHCEVGEVLQSLKTLSNNSDVDLLQHTGGHKATVYAYVINKNGQPLMPCKPAKARHLLKEGKAEVINRKPFTIRLLWVCEDNVEPITLGIDAGYSEVGFSAVSDEKELMSGELTLRKGISKLIEQNNNYRKEKRGRLWHRPPRFDNRARPEGWLAPSIQHKLDSHIRLVEQMKAILPITNVIVEVASFDIQKIKNPDIEGKEYQEGEQLGFWNVREYVLHRDNHTCQHCKGKKKDKILQVHHINGKKEGATDRPEELMTVCITCHDEHHTGIDIIPAKKIRNFKPETFMTIVHWKLTEILNCEHTFGYLTKNDRIKQGLEKSHVNDAFIIAGGNIQGRCNPYMIKQIRRNNRSIQMNRKGYKPSIRRQRYKLQPNDLVRCERYSMAQRIKGTTDYGRYVALKDGTYVNVKNVEVICYGKGMCYT